MCNSLAHCLATQVIPIPWRLLRTGCPLGRHESGLGPREPGQGQGVEGTGINLSLYIFLSLLNVVPNLGFYS